MWYRVVYIGGIGVLLKVLSCWYKQNIWYFSFPSSDRAIFYSNFKRKFPFQISKMKIFNFFISNFKKWKFSFFSFQFFVAYLKIFHFPLMVWPKFFKFEFTFQNQSFCSIFPISLWWYGQIFQTQKTKIFNSNFKNKNIFYFFSHFKFPLWHKQFFSWPEVAKFVKRLQKLHIYPNKNSHILHSTTWWYGPL
jgi:hypothetical protein